MATELNAATKITAVKAREQGGTKKKFHELVPKKGAITLVKLKETAKKELEVPAATVEAWVIQFAKRGLVKLG